MRKKLFSAVASIALCASLFAIDSMFLKLKNGNVVEYQVDDVQEVFFGESTPVVENPTKDDKTDKDTSIVDIPNFPLAIYPLSDSTAYLESVISPATFDSLVVPNKVRINGKIYNVTQIGPIFPGSFKDTKYIEIPSSVNNILRYSFYDCPDLNVVINNSRKNVELGAYPFTGCKSVTFTKDSIVGDTSIIDALVTPLTYKVLTDSTVEVAGSIQAYDNSIVQPMDLMIPSKVRIEGNTYTVVGIGNESLAGAPLLSVEIPSTVAYLGKRSFLGCLFSSIVIPSSVTVINGNAFESCSNLSSVKLPENVSLEFEAFHGCPIESIVIPSGSYVGTHCFSGNGALKNVAFEPGVVAIGSKAFMDCKGLTNVEIPSSVLTIGSYAFAGCDNLDVIVDNSEDSVRVGDWAFFECKSVKYLRNSAPVEEEVVDAENTPLYFEVLTDSTVEVQHAKFVDSIYIPAKVRIDDNIYSVVSIGDKSFAGADFIKFLSIPSGVKTIGEKAFYKCSDLENVNIPSSVTSIAQSAFFQCEKLSVVIDNPRDKVTIDDVAFCGCKSIKFADDPESADSYVNALVFPLKFEPTSDSTVSVTGWNYSNGECMFEKGVEIPSRVLIENKLYTVTSIGTRAFWSCDCLTSVKIPSTVDVIYGSAFEASSLTSVELPSKAYIEYGAFAACNNLKSVNVPAGAFLGQNAFRGTGLETVTLEEGLSYIGKYSFMECSHLTKVVIPSSVKTIRMGAFYDCKNLEVEVESSKDDIQFDDDYGYGLPDDPFLGCKSVKYKE